MEVAIVISSSSSILRTYACQQLPKVALRPLINLTISSRPDMHCLSAHDSSIAVIKGLACEASPSSIPLLLMII